MVNSSKASPFHIAISLNLTVKVSSATTSPEKTLADSLNSLAIAALICFSLRLPGSKTQPQANAGCELPNETKPINSNDRTSLIFALLQEKKSNAVLQPRRA